MKGSFIQMAHFAQLDNDKVVQQVIVIANEDCGGGKYPESEVHGQVFIAKLGLQGEWRQTSYNSNFRGSYAGIGYTFREDLDMFIPPKPFESWLLNEENGRWEAPEPMPKGDNWIWDEENVRWKQFEMEP